MDTDMIVIVVLGSILMIVFFVAVILACDRYR